AGALVRRGRARGHGRVVPREPRLVGADQVGRVPALLRAAVRHAPRRVLGRFSRRKPSVSAAGSRRARSLPWQIVGRTDRYRLRRPRLVRLAACSLLLFGGLSSGLLAATGRIGTTASIATGTGGVSTTTTTATTTTAPTLTASTARVVLAVTGHGWGHGLGLSQWGTYGYAKHGWTYDRILAHYYSGTTLGHSAVSSIRVQIADATKTVLSSSADWTATDATGKKAALAPGKLTLTKALAVDGAPLAPPITFASTEPLVVDGHPYRGSLVVSLDGKHVQVVDDVALESYLKGVVPSEMPSKWPAEALKAQAV